MRRVLLLISTRKPKRRGKARPEASVETAETVHNAWSTLWVCVSFYYHPVIILHVLFTNTTLL